MASISWSETAPAVLKRALMPLLERLGEVLHANHRCRDTFAMRQTVELQGEQRIIVRDWLSR